MQLLTFPWKHIGYMPSCGDTCNSLARTYTRRGLAQWDSQLCVGPVSLTKRVSLKEHTGSCFGFLTCRSLSEANPWRWDARGDLNDRSTAAAWITATAIILILTRAGARVTRVAGWGWRGALITWVAGVAWVARVLLGALVTALRSWERLSEGRVEEQNWNIELTMNYHREFFFSV